MIRKVGIGIMLFFVVLGIAYFIREIVVRQFDSSFWQVYVGSFAGVYGVFASAESFKKNSINKYYRAELDDKRPELQKSAIKRLTGDCNGLGSKQEK